MRYRIPIAVICLLPISLSAQNRTATEGFPADPSRNFIAVKAIGIPTFLFFNGMAGSVGGEYSVGRRHAIGISYAYAETGSKYSLNDSIQQTKGYPYKHSVERGLILYYRYYTRDWHRVSNNWVRPFISGFGRIGNADQHFDEGYETDQIKYDERQISAGALLGLVCTLQNGGLCLDTHIGPFHKWRGIRDAHFSQGVEVVDNRREQGWGVKFGVTLSYQFNRK